MYSGKIAVPPGGGGIGNKNHGNHGTMEPWNHGNKKEQSRPCCHILFGENPKISNPL
jgi:hypothetical protein